MIFNTLFLHLIGCSERARKILLSAYYAPDELEARISLEEMKERSLIIILSSRRDTDLAEEIYEVTATILNNV